MDESNSFVQKPKLIAFCAFQFDPDAARRIDSKKWPGVELLKVQMNVDLLTSDLKKRQRSADSFWLIGQPEIEVTRKSDEEYEVSVLGFDYFDVESGKLTSGSTERIVMWMLDTNFNGRVFVPNSIYFPNTTDDDHNWRKLEATLGASVDQEEFKQLEKLQSSPFKIGKRKRIAVKVVDDRGIESLCDKYLEVSMD